MSIHDLPDQVLITAPKKMAKGKNTKPHSSTCSTAFGVKRSFHGRRWVYSVISPRTQGFSFGINLNPHARCNFDCIYCEIKGGKESLEETISACDLVEELALAMRMHLQKTASGEPDFDGQPGVHGKHFKVAISGDGEPTLSPGFVENIEAILHFRARQKMPFFKLILVTNGSQFHSEEVSDAIGLLDREQDEIWVKCDVGNGDDFQFVNRCSLSLDLINQGIIAIGQNRPLVLQSAHMAYQGKSSSEEKISSLIERINYLKNQGTQIHYIQVYSPTKMSWNPHVAHLSLTDLSLIARRIQSETQIEAQIF